MSHANLLPSIKAILSHEFFLSLSGRGSEEADRRTDQEEGQIGEGTEAWDRKITSNEKGSKILDETSGFSGTTRGDQEELDQRDLPVTAWMR